MISVKTLNQIKILMLYILQLSKLMKYQKNGEILRYVSLKVILQKLALLSHPLYNSTAFNEIERKIRGGISVHTHMLSDTERHADSRLEARGCRGYTIPRCHLRTILPHVIVFDRAYSSLSTFQLKDARHGTARCSLSSDTFGLISRNVVFTKEIRRNDTTPFE